MTTDNRDKQFLKKGRGGNVTGEKLGNPLTDVIERPVAPLHLDYESRKLFGTIVESLPPDYFLECDLVLLELYCETYTDYRRYMKACEGQEVYEEDKGVMRSSP